eukprot:634979-Rhodomonas_salina.2
MSTGSPVARALEGRFLISPRASTRKPEQHAHAAHAPYAKPGLSARWTALAWHQARAQDSK